MDGKATEPIKRSYLDAVEQFPVAALGHAVTRYEQNEVPGMEDGWPPSVPQFVAQVRLFAQVHDRVVRPLHSGILEVDYGHGRIDLRGLTIEEQDEIMRHHGVINGCNLALMSLEGKKAALAGDETKKIEGFKPPAMKRMTE